jgi:hypothetical protein
MTSAPISSGAFLCNCPAPSASPRLVLSVSDASRLLLSCRGAAPLRPIFSNLHPQQRFWHSATIEMSMTTE